MREEPDMLTIKHRFPINKLSVSRMLYGLKDFFGRIGSMIVAGIASLKERSHSMGKKSILSSLVLLVGFFGSLSALLMLYPLATDKGSTQPARPTNANVETDQQAAANGVNGASSGSDTGSTKDPVGNMGTPSIVASPASPSPTAAPSQSPLVNPSTAAQSSPAPSPIVTQPTITSAPSAPAPAPEPVVSTPESDAPESAPLLPLTTDPVTNAVQDASKGLQDVTSGL